MQYLLIWCVLPATEDKQIWGSTVVPVLQDFFKYGELRTHSQGASALRKSMK